MIKGSKKKIALVVPNLPDGGGVQAVAAFIKDVIIESEQYDLKVISLSTASNDPDSALIRHPLRFLRGPRASIRTWLGLSVVHVGAWVGELEFMRYQPRRALAAAVAECDLIQVVCGGPAWANALLGLGKPVSVQCATRTKVERRRRDANPRSAGALWRKAMTAITDIFDDRALKHADAIQLENPWMLEYTQSLNMGHSADIRYAPPGVDESVFRPIPERNLEDNPYILCVARLNDPRKHIELLLESYALLPDQVRGKTKLKLAGSSGPPQHFWKRAEQLGLADRIEYIPKPSLEELVRLYQNAAAFALPSDEEGLGVVLLEAMACGIPVVSTRSGGPDGIISDAVDGYLVPLADATSLSKRLLELLNSPAKNIQMGRAARETIEKRYSKIVTGKEFIDVWERLLEERPGQRNGL